MVLRLVLEKANSLQNTKVIIALDCETLSERKALDCSAQGPEKEIIRILRYLERIPAESLG